MKESNAPKNKVPRREFLANLLFCGAALSVAGLQSEYDLVARRNPEDEGWELPKDEPKKPPKEDWKLPDDLMDSPEPPPRKPPRPPVRGRVRPPQILGKVKPPPPGGVRPVRPTKKK